MEFVSIIHPSPTTKSERLKANQVLVTASLTMVLIEYDENKGGWFSAKIGPREPILLDPAASVLHYAQEIFEGMKCFKHCDGSMALFRPQENARRFNASARRMAMPEIPENLFVKAVCELVKKDKDW